MSATPSRTRREGLYPGLIGLAVGALVVGLALPWTVDGERAEVVAGAGSAEPAAGTGEGATGEAFGAAEPGAAPASGAGGSLDGRATPAGAAGVPGSGATSSPAAAAGTGGPSPVPAAGAPVKIGFTLFDIAGASSLGFAIAVDPEDGRRAYQAFVDHLNATGGINGRKVEAVYSVYDLTNEDSQLASCLKLTQDHKVFAVIGGYSYSSANLCVVETNRTLLINDNSFTIDELYRSGRHVSMFSKGSRMMDILARRLDALGQIDGTRIGILADAGADPRGSTTDALARSVERLGGTVARRSMLNGDFASGSSQIPIEVNQMRAAGVQLVLLIASPLYGTQFAQQAESQGYRPTYAATDWQAMYSDVGASNMPGSFEGAFSITSTRTGDHRVDIPPTPKQGECARIYERMSKTKLVARSENGYGLVMGACDAVGLFGDAARNAGTELSHGSVVAAAQHVGRVDTARWAGGSLAPGKLDVSDRYRVNRFSNDCKCWMPSSPYTAY